MQEKQKQLGGLSINYKIIGTGKIPIVLLHGWGLSSDRYIITAEEILKLDNNFIFYIPDLPGFGKSEEPKTAWHIDDYVEFTRDFVNGVAQREAGFELIKNIISGVIKNNGVSFKKENKKVILLAHSFGGRIAIKYAVKYPGDIEAMVLTGAAGIKHPLTSRQQMFYRMAKIGKELFALPILKSLEKYAKKYFYVIVREKDYANAGMMMKEVMKNALAEDLTPFLEKVTSSTLLIWGEMDHSTPLVDGQTMNEKIEGSKLFVIKEANHSAVYNNAEEFAKIFLDNY